jgi:hypothetical protein
MPPNFEALFSGIGGDVRDVAVNAHDLSNAVWSVLLDRSLPLPGSLPGPQPLSDPDTEPTVTVATPQGTDGEVLGAEVQPFAPSAFDRVTSVVDGDYQDVSGRTLEGPASTTPAQVESHVPEP